MMTGDLARRGAAVRAKLWERMGRGRGVCTALAMLFGIFTGPVAAQNGQTTVAITSASPATFSAAGQLITFNVRLYTGNTPINGLRFTSGVPASITSALTCPGLPAGTQTTVNCTFAYTTQASDVALNRVLGYGRWTATRPNGANRSSDTNQLVVPYAAAPASPPTMSINDVTTSEGNAGTTNFTFSVGLSEPAGAGGVSFDIATANGTAAAGTDYVAKSLTGQIIPAGSSSYSFTVQVNGDTSNEPNENFFVNLTNVTGATVADGQGQGTITDDDPLPSLSIVSRNITERNALTQAEPLQVTLSAASGQSVSVNYATANGTATAGSDYVAASGTLVIPAGSTSGTISVGVAGDTTNEPDETFTVTLSSPVNATVATGTGTYTIVNDDAAPPTVTSISPTSGPTSGNTAVVIAGTNFSGATAVSFGAAAATGYTINSNTQITATAPAGSGTVDVRVTTAGGTSATSAADQYTYIAPPTVTSIAPTSGPTSGGTTVVIAGTNFSGATAISFGAAAATGYTINSNTQITATAPAGSGTVDVRVTTAGGTSATSAADQYTYIAPPLANNASATVAYGSSGNPITLNITGGAPTSVAVATAATHGTAIASGTSIAYTPAAGYAGPDSFTYTATNSAGTSAPATIAIVVSSPTIALSPASLPSANAGTAYSQTITATGGTPNYGYAITAGSLPANLVLDSGGVLSGTPTAVGVFNFTVTATDRDGFTGSQAYSVTVGTPTLTMTPAPGSVPMPYGQASAINFGAGGGTATYSFSLVAGSLPVGVSLSSAGVLSGTPTVPGDYNLTVRATDSSTGTGAPFHIDQSYTIVVATPSIAIDPASLPDGAVGTSYDQTIGASGGVAPYSFSLLAGALPIGMSFSSAGVFSGVPHSDGSFSLTVRATDANGQNASRVYAFNIAAPTLTINPATLPGGTNGVAYSQTMSTGGGIAPYAYSLTAGALPPGVALSSSGAISGMPNLAGSYNFTVRSTDIAGYHADIAYTLAIGEAGQTITFAAQAAQTFVVNGTFALNPLATASSGLAVSYSSQSAGVCSISGTTVTMLAAGNCVIAADQTGDANYLAAAQVMQTIAIGQSGQTITFAAQAAQTFVVNGTFALNPLATASSGLAVSYSSQSAGVCSISGTTVTMLAAGNCVIAADQTGDANYLAAAQVMQTIAIGKAAQAIANIVANPAAPVYASGGTFAISATGGASGNPVVFASTTPGVCSVSGSTVAILAAGVCSLTASQAGNTDYNAAPQVTLNVTVGAATPTLSWIDNQHRTIGEAAFDLPNPTSNSSGAFSFTSSNPSVATISGRTVTIVGAGQATLVATQAATGSYTGGTVSLVLTVDDRPDPTRDPEVAGGQQAQLDAAVRFASAQQANVHDRLRQLRSADGNASSNNLSVSLTGDNGPGLSLNADQVAGKSTLPKGWGVWTAGVVSLGDRDARNASQGFDWRSDGVTVGIDRLFGDRVVLGVAAGMGWNTTDFDRSPSQLDAKQRSVSLYGLWRSGKHAFADAALGVGHLEFDIDRWSDVAGKTATARREGGQTFGSLTVGYEQLGERAAWTGYGRYDMIRMRLDAYRENGLGIYDLRYASQDAENDTLALGVENRYAFKRAASLWRPYWKLEYRQALQNQGDATINYVVAPRSSDYLLGLRSYNDDVFSLGGGLDIDFVSGWALSFLFLREQANETTANSLGLRVSYGSASNSAATQYMPAPANGRDRSATGP